MTASPYVLLDDSLTPGGRSLLYTEPELVVTAYAPDEVEAALDEISAGLARGLHAAGFFSYELGYCLEPKLGTLLPADRGVPLFWIGLFRAPRPFDDSGTRAWLDEHGGAERAKISDLKLSWSREQYDRAFAAVEDYIAAGDVYQINLTLKYHFAFEGDPVALYAALRRKQRVAYGALIHTSELDVLSLSPELFFRRAGKHMSTRPMKGTAPRGRTPREDARLKTWLAMDEKQRAENLMIVDLLRNDLGRVAKIGSVEVTDLFTVETYRSVHQMTSGISAELRSDMGLKDMLRALFPCGSVAGAPKVRAMEIIRELEAGPRGFHLLDRHLARLQSSAAHFGYPFSREAVLAALDAEALRVEAPVALVRLLLGEDGAITVTSTPISLPTKDTVWRFVISDQRLDEKDPLFYRKTTRRQFFDREMERQKALTGCDEVVTG